MGPQLVINAMAEAGMRYMNMCALAVMLVSVGYPPEAAAATVAVQLLGQAPTNERRSQC